MDMYAENILDHYRNPHHYGSLEDATVSAEDANPLCGDTMHFDVKIDDYGKITGIAFRGEGCAISQASASMLSDEMLEKSVVEAVQFSNDKVYQLLGVPLSPARVKCALLALVVLKKALQQL